MGDGPIQEQHRDLMNRLARALDQMFNEDKVGPEREWGFFLAVFPFGEGAGRFNYISNADRRDIVVLLKEMTARFEGQPEMQGRA